MNRGYRLSRSVALANYYSDLRNIANFNEIDSMMRELPPVDPFAPVARSADTDFLDDVIEPVDELDPFARSADDEFLEALENGPPYTKGRLRRNAEAAKQEFIDPIGRKLKGAGNWIGRNKALSAGIGAGALGVGAGAAYLGSRAGQGQQAAYSYRHPYARFGSYNPYYAYFAKNKRRRARNPVVAEQPVGYSKPEPANIDDIFARDPDRDWEGVFDNNARRNYTPVDPFAPVARSADDEFLDALENTPPYTKGPIRRNAEALRDQAGDVIGQGKGFLGRHKRALGIGAGLAGVGALAGGGAYLASRNNQQNRGY